MTNDRYPRLCGGTFFVLLLQTIKQRQKARDRFGGGSDGLNTPSMLKSLIRVAQPEYIDPAKSTFDQNTSDYKACKISGGTYLPFEDIAFASTFDACVKNDYPTELAAMLSFVNSYIDVESPGKRIRLVKALIDLISLDRSISPSEYFYVCPNGQPITKTALCAMIDVHLPAFLLGIWHYVVTSRKDNTVGRATFEDWHTAPRTSGAQWSYSGNIGESITRGISVTVPETVVMEDETATTTKQEPFADHGAATEDRPVSEPAASATTQVLNAPVVFFNSGANCTQIHNAGILNINKGEKHE